MTKTRRTPRTLAQLEADPRVREVWREHDGCWDTNGGRSYWAALADGWKWEGCSTLHEPTVKRLCAALSQAYTEA